MKTNTNEKNSMMIVASIIVLLFIGASASNNAIINQNQVFTPTFISTVSPTTLPIIAATASNITNDYVTHIELVDIIENVTSQHLSTINLSIGIVGIGLAIFGFFSISAIFRIQKVASESQERLDQFKKRETEWSNELQKVKALASLYIFVLELRDPNPDLRRRALQRLRATGDIMAVSHITYVLASDPDASIRAEAALALNDLLPEDVEESTLLHAVDALTKALSDKGKSVAVYSLKTLAPLISRGEPIPLFTLEKIQELANSRDKNLAQVAKEALSNLHKNQS